MKSFVKIALLFVLLGVFAVMPVWISSWSSERIIDKLYVVNFDEDEVRDKVKSNSVFDKIMTVLGAQVVSTGVFGSDGFDKESKIKKDAIIELLNLELKTLQYKKAIPVFDIGGTWMIESISKKTYIGREGDLESVSLWDVTVFYDETYRVSVLMDVNTNKIYQIDVKTMVDLKFFDCSSVKTKGYLDYLGVSDLVHNDGFVYADDVLLGKDSYKSSILLGQDDERGGVSVFCLMSEKAFFYKFLYEKAEPSFTIVS